MTVIETTLLVSNIVLIFCIALGQIIDQID